MATNSVEKVRTIHLLPFGRRFIPVASEDLLEGAKNWQASGPGGHGFLGYNIIKRAKRQSNGMARATLAQQ